MANKANAPKPAHMQMIALMSKSSAEVKSDPGFLNAPTILLISCSPLLLDTVPLLTNSVVTVVILTTVRFSTMMVMFGSATWGIGVVSIGVDDTGGAWAKRKNAGGNGIRAKGSHGYIL